MRSVREKLVGLATQGTDALRIADSGLSLWHGIDAALSPIIGARGVAALYERSLHLACPAHPWFASVKEHSAEPGDFTPLQTALAGLPRADAAAASAALLHTFLDLLTSLIGTALTEQLLASVGDTLASAAAQDDTP